MLPLTELLFFVLLMLRPLLNRRSLPNQRMRWRIIGRPRYRSLRGGGGFLRTGRLLLPTGLLLRARLLLLRTGRLRRFLGAPWGWRTRNRS